MAIGNNIFSTCDKVLILRQYVLLLYELIVHARNS